MEVRWNWTEFCGTNTFSIWTKERQDLTSCFQILCLQIPILSAIAVVSAYYSGKYENCIIRTSREKVILKFRLYLIFLLGILPGVRLMIQVLNESQSSFTINYWFVVVESFTWFVHLCFVFTLKNRLGLGLKGPIVLTSLWTLFYVVCIIRFRSVYFDFINNPSPNAFTLLLFGAFTIIFQTLYGLSLIPSEDSRSTQTAGFRNVDPNDSSYTSLLTDFARFREDFDPFYLGAAAEGSNYISKFVFWWVNPLMKKGLKGLLKEPEDVFDLPDYLTSTYLYEKLTTITDSIRSTSSQISILKKVHKRFAREFYSVGLLKFTADIAGFITPMLLHQLINFVEDLHIPVWYGYLYGSGILLTSLIGSFCIVHFDFYVGKINLKLQGSLIPLIYRKIFALNPCIMREVSLGKILNYISVDMERISNSCISFHAVWSIPFRLAVTLYLLYTQIGIAFLAGVAFSIIVIPINRFIAIKIGTYSGRLMETKDQRVETMSEIIKGMRILKLHVWEDYFVSKILGIRTEELKYLKYRKYLDALCVYFWATTPVIISLLTFTVYVILGGKLKAETVFTSFALLNMMIAPLNDFPWVLNGIIEAWISVKRLNFFLELDNVKPLEYHAENIEKYSVCVKNGAFSWSEEKLNLRDINLFIQENQLVGVWGSMGCGKTSLLSAILGEMNKVDGIISLKDTINGVGFVSQTPWVQHCSVRDNILFGKPYDAFRYRNVIDACALMDDINSWPNGDFQLVGEGGINLSGGQKSRVALARAVYQDVDLYLLDDVLSAVDWPVAWHIFEECFRKLLNGKTRILVTHSKKLLRFVDWVLVLENGRITKQGHPSVLFANDEEDLPSSDLSVKYEEKNNILNNIRDESSEEIQKETSAHGSVSIAVYMKYLKSVGYFLGSFILILVLAMQVSRIAADWWLSIWISASEDRMLNVTQLYYFSTVEQRFFSHYGSNVHVFLRTYLALGIINSIIVIMRAFFFAYGGIRAARVVHKKLLYSISHATMEFFEVSPLGRILNRFSSDTNVVDDSLPFDINILLAQFAAVLGTVFVTVYGIPWLCLFVAPLLPIYLWLQNEYRLTSRELKRLVSVSLSPLYSHVSDTITGNSTIRAFGHTSRFIRENHEKVDTVLKCNLSSLAAAMWLNIRLQIIGLCVIGGICLITVLQRHFDVAHSVFVGLALSYALTLTSSLGSLVNIFVETERKMVAMERVNEYIEEVKLETSHWGVQIPLPFTWPCLGIVSFSNVHLKYGNNSTYSLKNISFETHPCEKIGIVGRTGSGKSSLLTALFRLTEISSGIITIDAVNTKMVPLKKLRSKITIIPQDPFIFAGSIRENLDPLNEYDDFEVWEAVRKCNLVSLIIDLGGMNAVLQTGGTNLSVGEKQLLCLIRAVLKNRKIVCIDEASANVDRETDIHIQRVVRHVCESRTVLIITHKVQSVINCDRILVMGHGEILEFDSPQTLLQNPQSHFSDIVKENYVR